MLPTSNFARKILPIEVISAGKAFLRIHKSDFDPRFFGPAPGQPPTQRFDTLSHRTCYVGRSFEACLAETLLRQPGLTIISELEFAKRSLAQMTRTKPLRLVQMLDNGLKKLGTTALATTGDYEMSGTWAEAIFQHPADVDGILYRSSRDDSQICAAIFDRAKDGWIVELSVSLLGLGRRLDEALTCYDVGVDPG